MNIRSSRTALAAVATLVVVALLTIAAASSGKTRGYRLHSPQGDAQTDRVKLDVTPSDTDRFNVGAPTFITRVRTTIHMGPIDGSPVPVLAYHENAGSTGVRVDVLRQMPQKAGRQGALEFTAVVFALFGLFVLWWGRDRPSLWLGLFCASFAPAILTIYGVLPEGGMLVAYVFADSLFYVSLYSFFAIALSIALDAMRPNDTLRSGIGIGREIALALILFAAVVDFAETIGPTMFVAPVWPLLVDAGDFARVACIAITLGIGPVALLAIGLWRASDTDARKRVRVTLYVTLAAESGVLAAICEQILAHKPIGYDNAWYTLLFIPIGFMFGIQAYKVVEIKFVLNRLLVLTTMTVIIASVIVLSQLLFEEKMPKMVGNWLGIGADDVPVLIRFVIALTIVLTFNRLHEFLDELFKALFFRRRDEAVRALHDFTMQRAQFITARPELLQQAIELVCTSVGTEGSAFYEESGNSYVLSSACGSVAWPGAVGENDPAFTLLRSGNERVELARLGATPSVLGKTGIAIRMAVSTRVLVGALVIGARVKESDGPYEREELAALVEIARSVSEALFALRANETAEFIRGVADGSICGGDAIAKAEEICERGLPGVDTSLRARPAKADSLPSIWPPLPASAPASTE